MLGKIKEALFERKVRRLARQAISEAIRLYQSGEFRWVKGTLLGNGGSYFEASLPAVSKSTYGCVIGSVAKAAWIVCGRPATLDDPNWILKAYVEAEAERIVYESTRTLGLGTHSPVRYNDDEDTSLKDVIEKVLVPALDFKSKLPLATEEPYNGAPLPQRA